jgi:hypothetical protein
LGNTIAEYDRNALPAEREVCLILFISRAATRKDARMGLGTTLTDPEKYGWKLAAICAQRWDIKQR